MKVFYKSKLAKILTFFKGFKTIMFFGVLLTENETLPEKTIKHEEAHALQYYECMWVGATLTIITMFTLFACGVQSIWMLLLILIPLSAFYILYGVEWLIKWATTKDRLQAYKDVSFERHARWIAETWDKPCPEQHHYISFGWLKFM